MDQTTDRTIVHVDMDAFYASVEQLDNPVYRGKPVVVGADPEGGTGRGVVSAASYEARKYGIHSAQPISTAYRCCPDAVFVRPRFRRYEELSKKVMSILGEFSPVVEQISIDEAFLDCTGTQRLHGAGQMLAQKIKRRIREETGLTASIGIAGNKSVAKIASELGKPDGCTVCPPGGEGEFLAALPLKYLWGAGPKTRERLESLGFHTIGQVASATQKQLVKLFGRYGGKLHELANGIDTRLVHTEARRKSISEEVTFRQDVDEDGFIELALFEIADRLTRHMRQKRFSGRTITLKIRLSGFETHTRSRSLPDCTNDLATVRSTAVQLYREFSRRGKKVRLIGIGVSNLRFQDDEVLQPDLFLGEARKTENRESADRVLDMLKDRYGEKVTRGAFLRTARSSAGGSPGGLKNRSSKRQPE
jgi:DNA polymerase-4